MDAFEGVDGFEAAGGEDGAPNNWEAEAEEAEAETVELAPVKEVGLVAKGLLSPEEFEAALPNVCIYVCLCMSECGFAREESGRSSCH